MMTDQIPREYAGWWRIIETSQWADEFTWKGAWEYDQKSGTGNVRLGKDGRLRGKIRIKNGDDSTFIAERTAKPDEPIPDPPSYREKWRRRG